MIAKLKGLLESVGEHAIIVDVGGVGYLLHCSRHTLGQLPPLGEAIELDVETIFKQESLTLYGFQTIEEKEAFRLLQRVQGVGTRVALAILSVLSPAQIYECIQLQDHAPITQADGVGPKVAQRIVRELKDKLGDLTALSVTTLKAGSLGTLPKSSEALSALLHLGYKRNEALGALQYVRQEAPEKESVDDIIPLALKYLGTKLK